MAGHFQTFIVSRNGNTVTLYRDAAVLDTYASFGTTDYKCFCLGGSTANGYLGRQGNVYCGIWMRELTASEIASVTSDPYQFLIPA